ncbi:aspartate--tRNA ligase, mitochondrial-like [Liolophura sinensis]|uniref:aspartate--tRNA ligase, mitochondrial-like n=1 Tax=Liolophura sinensis TaxID=3198878 RepID=UPI0031595EFF
MSRKVVCCFCKSLQAALQRPSVRQLAGRSFSKPPDIGRQTSFSGRSHTCGELTKTDIGKQVTICGWVQHQRLQQFVVLRDWHGLTQVIIPDEKKPAVPDLALESVIQVTGLVQERPDGQQNTKMPTGEIEVVLKDIQVLNECKPNLPFNIQDFHKVKEALRMEYRYLDLRNKDLQRNLRLRSEMVMKMREFLCNQNGFVDVETPTLFRQTPGGAKEFVVPSRFAGKFYTLPQSPQQFKQLLMVGGIDRYVQIARCYRDEGSKPERQPEFTQVDIEMSFVNQDNVLDLVEHMLVHCWPESKGRLSIPFPRMTYHEAMAKYGVDKPDTRFDMQICDVTDIIRESNLETFRPLLDQPSASIQAVNITGGALHFSNKDISSLQSVVQENSAEKIFKVIKVKEDGSLQSPLVKHLRADDVSRLKATLKPLSGDLILLSGGNQFEPHSVLGRLRLECASLLESKGVEVRKKADFNFLWVVDFPLFLPKEGGGVESAHHPFTAAHPDDAHLLTTHPNQVRSQHYDLVVNGSEIGGGSIRIHNADEQRFVLEKVLQEDCSELSHLLDALESGCPPHGGIALGLDRLMAVVCGTPSIRDVIAFPKSHDGKDPMSKAPAVVSQEELDVYHIQIKDT